MTRIIPALIIIFLAACSDTHNKKQISILGNYLQEEARKLKMLNDNAFITIEGRQYDPRTVEKSRKTIPGVVRIRKTSSAMLATLDSLMSVSPKSKIPDARKGRQTLFYQLLACKMEMQQAIRASVDAVEEKIFHERLDSELQEMPLLKGISGNSGKKETENYYVSWADSNFSVSSPQLTSLILYKIANDVLLSENLLLNFCAGKFYNYSTAYMNWDFQSFVLPDRTDVRSGDSILLFSGTIDTKVKVKIAFVNNKRIIVSSFHPSLQHYFRAHGAPGKYSFPVKIDFEYENGEVSTLKDTIHYNIIP